MQKTFTDLSRHALNGETMGTRWSALFYGAASFEVAPVHAAMTKAVGDVDQQMSAWKPDSDLNRLNNASTLEWVELPQQLMDVLDAGLKIGQSSSGAFDIGVGDAVAAWGFGPREADEGRIQAARLTIRSPAHEMLELDLFNRRARKHAEMRFDLNGIAKGYGVDRLAETAAQFDLKVGLFAIDGELRAIGSQPDGNGWSVAVEVPDFESRAVHSIIALQDAAVATSGDYRHWVDVGGRRLSHTMDPRFDRPLIQSPASATVIAADCMHADAWATVMMVLGEAQGLALAKNLGLSVLFLQHGQSSASGCGIFAEAA